MRIYVEQTNLKTAFNAMTIFLTDYWERGGRSSDDMATLLGSLGSNRDGFPMDIALWDDWRKAYARAEAVADDNSGQ